MRRIAALLLLLCICTMFCACGSGSRQSAAPAQPSKSPEIETYEHDLSDKVSRAIPFAASVSVSHGDDRDEITIRPAVSDVTHFGDRVYDSIIACDEVLAESSYTLYLIDLNTATGKMLSFHHYNDRDEFGTFFDDRTSPTKITKCSTADDLATSFPALRTHIAELEVAQESPEEMALYKYVMDRLDAEPDRDEMEIFEEIAPEYGMTTDELKQFMFDMMEKVY